MKGVVVLAHGSREDQAAAGWRRLERAVRAKLGNGTSDDAPVIFQFGMSGLPQALDTLSAAGADNIVILPYFLFTGTHLSHTVPDLMRTWQEAHPKVRLSLSPALGEDARLASLLADLITRA